MQNHVLQFAPLLLYDAFFISMLQQLQILFIRFICWNVCTICSIVKTVFGSCKCACLWVSLWETLFFIIINQCSILSISPRMANARIIPNEWKNEFHLLFHLESICIDANDRNKSFHLLRAILKPFEIINQAFVMIVIFPSPHFVLVSRSIVWMDWHTFSFGCEPFNHFTKSLTRKWR